MRRLTLPAALVGLLAASTAYAQPAPAGAPPQAPKTTTRDVAFTTHDGYPMTGRLTLPDTPGPHSVMIFVQNAEASTFELMLRNLKGDLVPYNDLYRDNLAPLGMGFFCYEGRGVFTDRTARRGQRIERDVYNTSSRENKVRDNGDGTYTVADARIRAKPLLDALAADNVAVVQQWLAVSAVVDLPEGWLKDRFAHPPMWTYISKLTIPVGVFQGEVDANTPASSVRALQQHVNAARLANVEFQCFADLDHGLGSTDYFWKGQLSAGYAAIFDFVRTHVGVK
jgi:hypothetical protein